MRLWSTVVSQLTQPVVARGRLKIPARSAAGSAATVAIAPPSRSLEALKIRYQWCDLGLRERSREPHVVAGLHGKRIAQPCREVAGRVVQGRAGEGGARAEVREVRPDLADEALHAGDRVAPPAADVLHRLQDAGRREPGRLPLLAHPGVEAGPVVGDHPEAHVGVRGPAVLGA